MGDQENPEIVPETQEPELEVAPAEVDFASLINQMRVQVVGVGLAFLILSLAFNFYVFRHNSKLRMQRDALNEQGQNLQKAEARFQPVINDLALYTGQRPQLRVLFERNGMQFSTNQPAAAPSR